MIVRGLATWRLTQLVVEDEITRPAREWVARRWPDSPVNYLLGCRKCVSVWAGIVVVLAPKRICTVLAASAFSILLDHVRDQQSARMLRARMTHAAATRTESQSS